VSTKSLRQQFADTMLSLGTADPELVVLVGDISHFILQPFAEACPGRYYNVGICEPTIVGMAAGLSRAGLRPVVHTIAPFLIERSFEQFKLDFCYHRLGGNVVTVGSAFDYSNLGVTHHCYGDFALFKTLPDTEIVYPSTPIEFDRLFRQCYRNDRLSLFRLPARQHGVVFADDELVLGRGLRVAEGSDLTIVAIGPQLANAVTARRELVELGWDPELLYLHSIRPLDVELIRSAATKTGRVLVVEEHMLSGGLGDDIRRVTDDLDGARVVSLAIPDRFVTSYGSYEQLCASVGLTAEGIVARVTSAFGAP
jgi:transketolase